MNEDEAAAVQRHHLKRRGPGRFFSIKLQLLSKNELFLSLSTSRARTAQKVFFCSHQTTTLPVEWLIVGPCTYHQHDSFLNLSIYTPYGKKNFYLPSTLPTS